MHDHDRPIESPAQAKLPLPRLSRINYWQPVPLTPVADLDKLRADLLALRPTRFPRWKLRYAPDLVVELQPLPGEARDRYRIFEGRAFLGDGIRAEHFSDANALTTDGILRLLFGIDVQWRFRPRSISRRKGAEEIRARLLAALAATGFKPAPFSPACAICGRGLTDAASMARGIGPECWGTNSISVPWLLRRVES